MEGFDWLLCLVSKFVDLAAAALAVVLSLNRIFLVGILLLDGRAK